MIVREWVVQVGIGRWMLSVELDGWLKNLLQGSHIGLALSRTGDFAARFSQYEQLLNLVRMWPLHH
jgi:hypothetical protein